MSLTPVTLAQLWGYANAANSGGNVVHYHACCGFWSTRSSTARQNHLKHMTWKEFLHDIGCPRDLKKKSDFLEIAKKKKLDKEVVFNRSCSLQKKHGFLERSGPEIQNIMPPEEENYPEAPNFAMSTERTKPYENDPASILPLLVTFDQKQKVLILQDLPDSVAYPVARSSEKLLPLDLGLNNKLQMFETNIKNSLLEGMNQAVNSAFDRYLASQSSPAMSMGRNIPHVETTERKRNLDFEKLNSDISIQI